MAVCMAYGCTIKALFVKCKAVFVVCVVRNHFAIHIFDFISIVLIVLPIHYASITLVNYGLKPGINKLLLLKDGKVDYYVYL